MNVALKEWGAITAALAAGRQIALLRKGGLAEASGGGFRLLHSEFLLFPTHEHEHVRMLRPEFHHLVCKSRSSELSLEVLAQVRDVVRAPEDPQKLLEAGEEFIWNEAYVRQRYDYRPELPLWLLVVRAFRLPSPLVIPNRPSYAGCKSWVHLTEEISVETPTPVLSDGDFEQRRRRLLDRLLG